MVLSSDSEMLGYLPKDISQCLAPLIDDYDLKFKGTITSVPKNSSEAVPIKVVCHKMTSDGWKECEFYGDFKPLWEKVLQIVDHQMHFRYSSMTASDFGFLLDVDVVLFIVVSNHGVLLFV